MHPQLLKGLLDYDCSRNIETLLNRRNNCIFTYFRKNKKGNMGGQDKDFLWRSWRLESYKKSDASVIEC